MIAATESVVTDILNCLGIAETTETVVIDVLQCWMRRRILNYTNYIEKVLSGMIADTEFVVLDVLHTFYFYFNCYCWSVVAWAQLVW
jgi:hypothetical protein